MFIFQCPYSDLPQVVNMSDTEEKVVVVTGGTSTVGMGLQQLIKETIPRNEKWIFLESKDADLT